jgi:hypothetical protein
MKPTSFPVAHLVLFKASISTDKSCKVIEFFKSISYDGVENDEAGENDKNIEARTFGLLPAYFTGSNQVFIGEVLDPISIKPRGLHVRRGLRHSTRDLIPGTTVIVCTMG